jgi:hypothetical protein
MNDESKSLMDILNEVAPSLREVPIQLKGTTVDIINEREKTHGVYKSTAAWSQSLKDMFRSSGNWASLNDGQREALEMIAVKLARLLNGNPQFPDHWDDLAGYGKLGSNSIENLDSVSAKLAADMAQALSAPSES